MNAFYCNCNFSGACCIADKYLKERKEMKNFYLMKIKNRIWNFIEEEDGIGTVEMILILVVLIGLVLIFKSQLTSLVNTIFDKINSQAGKV